MLGCYDVIGPVPSVVLDEISQRYGTLQVSASILQELLLAQPDFGCSPSSFLTQVKDDLLGCLKAGFRRVHYRDSAAIVASQE